MALRHLYSSSARCLFMKSHLKDSAIRFSYYSTSEANEEREHQLSTLNPFSQANQDTVGFLNDLKPPIKRSFNLAAYVNHSHTLQELLKLGVSLFDIESTNHKAAQFLLNLDFERDCSQHIRFLVDNGLKERNLGRFISEFPMLFGELLDDLQTRLNYYESKGFSKRQIAGALNKSSHLIAHKTKTIDYKLGLIQIEFNMPAKLIRTLVSAYPLCIAMPEEQFKIVNLTLNGEFGFRQNEINEMVVTQPCILELPRPNLIERLELVHNEIGLRHRQVVSYPKLITGPRLEIRARAMYLKKLKRDQYDPKRPLYVPPSALYKCDDEEFCKTYAKTTLSDYKLFLRSQ